MTLDRTQWDSAFGDDGTITLENGTVIDISDTTLDQMMSSIEAVVTKEVDGRLRGKLRKGSGQNIRVDLDKRDVAWASRIIEGHIDPRYPTRAHIIRDGMRIVLRMIAEDHKTGSLDKFMEQDRSRRNLEESAEIAAEQHLFFSNLRSNVATCFGDSERMEYLQQQALAFYVSGITEWQKQQLKSIFPTIGG